MELSLADAVRSVDGQAADGRDRAFWIGLATAAVLHALLFVGVGKTVPRQIGDPGGSRDGIAVDLVDAADLLGSSIATPGQPGQPGPPPDAATPPAEPPPPAPAAEAAPPPPPPLPPVQETKAEPPTTPTPSTLPTPASPPEPPAPKADATPPPAEAAPQKAEPVPAEAKPEPAPVLVEPAPPQPKPPEPKRSADRKQERVAKKAETIEKEVPDLLRLTLPPEVSERPAQPQPKARPAPPQPAPQQQPARPQQPSPQKQASADPSRPPSPATRSFGGFGGATAARPPGHTRSGENDEFFRRVVAALRQVMPQVNLRGRVTVHLVLNEHGNLADVKLVANSGDASLVTYVVFSTRQASFPLPPPRAPEVDRTFRITYIYE